MKKPKAPKSAHTANTKYGMGNYYGTGIKAKIGRMRSDSVGMIPLSPRKLKTPPRGLA